jgi:disulfide bond formation protein DsbB
MCYWQRWPHFAAIILAFFAFAMQNTPEKSRFFVWLAALAIFTSGAIGVYHAGVEAGIFEGLTQCSSGLSGGTSAEILADIMATPIIRCDEIQFSFLGISMAGWNACLSIGFSLIIIWLSIKKSRSQAA